MANWFARGVWLLGALAMFASIVGSAQARPHDAPRLATLGRGEIIGAALDPARQVRNRALRRDALRAYLSRKSADGPELSATESLGAPWVAIRLGTVTIGPPANADPCSAGLCPNPIALADDLRVAGNVMVPPISAPAPKPTARADGTQVCACVFMVLTPQGRWAEMGTTLIAPPTRSPPRWERRLGKSKSSDPRAFRRWRRHWAGAIGSIAVGR